MKRSSKAALLSALVFPGAGHMYLKQFAIGILLSGGTAAALYSIISDVVHNALVIVEKIQIEGVIPDIYSIASLVSEHSSSDHGSSLSIASTVLIVLWIIGIVDSYRQGRFIEKNDEVSVTQKTE